MRAVGNRQKAVRLSEASRFRCGQTRDSVNGDRIGAGVDLQLTVPLILARAHVQLGNHIRAKTHVLNFDAIPPGGKRGECVLSLAVRGSLGNWNAALIEELN